MGRKKATTKSRLANFTKKHEISETSERPYMPTNFSCPKCSKFGKREQNKKRIIENDDYGHTPRNFFSPTSQPIRGAVSPIPQSRPYISFRLWP